MTQFFKEKMRLILMVIFEFVVKIEKIYYYVLPGDRGFRERRPRHRRRLRNRDIDARV